MNLGDPLVFWILHYDHLDEVKKRNEHLPGVVDSMFRHCEYHGYVRPAEESESERLSHMMERIGPYRKTDKGLELYQKLEPVAKRMQLIQ